jgi:DNA repair exonuclease SbcCD ATPase subunit
MAANYGVLKGDKLSLSPGLNIITAPNERGKSSWCSFIKSMLYGVDSSAREKGGVKPDKLKFAPWSGETMSGRMEIESDFEHISLTRTGRDSAPMRELSALHAGTGEAVLGLSSAPGETLLGVSREVFERSAFIGQGSVTVSASPELEKRIAAIVQTGQEGISFTDAEERLKAAMRARRFNKTGRLPEIERELEALKDSSHDLAAQRDKLEKLKLARDTARARRDGLMKKLAESREKQRKLSLEALNESRARIKALESEYERKRGEAQTAGQELLASRFGKDEPEAVRGEVEKAVDELRQLNDPPFKGLLGVLQIAFALLTPIILVVVWMLSFAVLDPLVLWLVEGTILILGSLSFGYITRKKRRLSRQIADILARYGASSPEDIQAAADTHAKAFALSASLNTERDALYERLLAERQRQEESSNAILRDLDFQAPGSEAAALARQLEDAEMVLRRMREELAAGEGRISALGGEDAKAKIEQLNKEHTRLSLEYEALALAAQTLRQAGTEIQNRMTPRLSKRAGEIFSRLTGGRYEALVLDRELRALARLSGDTQGRESAFLSAGALDQLYLALRLAICELALPEERPCPLILDDALGSFDDERCRLALEFLRELSETRQVILFSCHTREAQMMSAYGSVNAITI